MAEDIKLEPGDEGWLTIPVAGYPKGTRLRFCRQVTPEWVEVVVVEDYDPPTTLGVHRGCFKKA